MANSILLGTRIFPLLSLRWTTLWVSYRPLLYLALSLRTRGCFAGFTVHVLTSLPPSSLHNTTFRIQGERASLSAIGALYYEAGDPPIPVVHVDKLPEGSERQTLAQNKFSRGHGSTGWDYYLGKDVPENADSGNKAWEGHRWKTIREVLDL